MLHPGAAPAGVRQHAGDIKRGMGTARGIMPPCAPRTADAADGVPVRYFMVSRGQGPCLLVCRPLARAQNQRTLCAGSEFPAAYAAAR